MVDSSNDYAKYKPQMGFPEDPHKPYIGDYNMNNPDDIRAYADAMSKYNAEYEKGKKALDDYRHARNLGMKLFHDDLMKEDLEEGISLDALETVWHIVYNHGHSFYEWEHDYDELAEIARQAHRAALRKK